MSGQEMLFDPPARSGPGAIEAAVTAELEKKIADGLMDRELYAGQIAQAVTLAREVDATVGVGRQSGRAQIHDVLQRLLFDLPQPEQVSSSSELERALQLIMEQDGAG